MNLAEEIASDNTDKAVVDSLLDAISDEQRALQESIIAYIDSLKELDYESLRTHEIGKTRAQKITTVSRNTQTRNSTAIQ